MSTAIAIVLITRVAIGIASGEIAIRYFEWWFRIRHEQIVTRNVLIGVAGAAFCLWGIETTYMWQRSTPPFYAYQDLTASNVLFEGWRLGLIISSIWFAAPVMFAHYRKNPREALIEMGIRVFLMAMVSLGTWELATIHYCSHGGCT